MYTSTLGASAVNCSTSVGRRQNAASVVGTSNDDFGNAAGACVFGNLRGDVLAVNRGDACAELFGQAQVAAQAGEALAIQLPGAGNLNKQGGETVVKCIGKGAPLCG